MSPEGQVYPYQELMQLRQNLFYQKRYLFNNNEIFINTYKIVNNEKIFCKDLRLNPSLFLFYFILKKYNVGKINIIIYRKFAWYLIEIQINIHKLNCSSCRQLSTKEEIIEQNTNARDNKPKY
jgi:hypothetical protein